MTDWREIAKEFLDDEHDLVTCDWPVPNKNWGVELTATSVVRMAEEIARLRDNKQHNEDDLVLERQMFAISMENQRKLQISIEAERAYSEKLREALVEVAKRQSPIEYYKHGSESWEIVDKALALKRPGE